MQTVPVIEEIGWSRNVLAHLALLQQALAVPPVTPSQAPVATPQFDVVSIKPCPPFGLGGRSAGGGRSGGVGIPAASPGTMNLNCGPQNNTVEQLIRQAYVTYVNGQQSFQTVAIEGGPAWIKSDRFEILARAAGNPSREMMRGPMLQALLEERFKLKLHRDVREIPVYVMTVSSSGLKGSRSGRKLRRKRWNTGPMYMTPDAAKVLQPGQRCSMIAYNGKDRTIQ
jgi:uncharacterized protein (TIGR03435 family)